MKPILIFLFVLLFSNEVFSCPNLTGAYIDEDGNTIVLTQINCEKIIWQDPTTGTTDLIADNVERVVEQDGNNIAYGKARFTKNEFILELRAVYGSKMPDGFPTHFLTSYRIDKYNNMVEKIVTKDSLSYVTFRRVKKLKL